MRAEEANVEREPCLYVPQALQSVGNLGLQLGHGKEQWMAPLHPIILRSVASVKDFLDKLIDIDHDIGKDDNGEQTPSKEGRAIGLISHRPAVSGQLTSG